MMPKTDPRPVYLNLFQFRFPPNALLSISHRISGVVLIVSLCIWLGLLNLMVFFPQSDHQAWLSSWSGQVFIWGFWSALALHWLAGARHLFIEFCINPRFKQLARTNHAALLMFAVWLATTAWIGWEVWQ